MTIRPATEKDNSELLKLTQACPMEGTIGLLIDRKPDFFSLLQTKGDYTVFVAETADLQLVGSFALVIKWGYIHQRAEKIGYLCDLKIAPSHRSTLVAYRLLKCMYQYMQRLPIHFYLCVVAKGNTLVENLIRGRAGIPAATKVTDFCVYQFLPLRKPKQPKHPIQPFDERYREDALRLLNDYYRNYQFATVFHPQDDITGDIAWGAFDGEQLVGYISLVDMDCYKQNVVQSIPFYLKVLLNIIRVLWPSQKIAHENEPIKMLYVKYLAFAPRYEQAALSLVHYARHYTQARGYSFLSYGLDRCNALTSTLGSIPKITFHSQGYLFDFSAGKQWPANSLCHDNFYQV